MFCPYYKNREVFDGFNEMIEALGGKPMTEEEFKSSWLRNQREGLDYSAMEAAYTLYDMNGGNMLDLAPNGKDSKLFSDLLDYCKGDRAKAIRLKSQVYSKKFLNWFGDWTGNATNNTQNSISKVVDENGEPLAVWHGSPSTGIQEFSRDLIGTNSDQGVFGKGFYFTPSKSYAGQYGLNLYLVYLDIKNPIYKPSDSDVIGRTYEEVSIDINKAYLSMYDRLIRRGKSEQEAKSSAERHVETVRQSNERMNLLIQENHDGGIYLEKTTNQIKPSEEQIVVVNPNQIKHVENLGEWSTEDNDIYSKKYEKQSFVDKLLLIQKQLQPSSLNSVFGTEISLKLQYGFVSSDQVLDSILKSNSVSLNNVKFANVLKNHKIPVTLSVLEPGIVATTVTDENGGSVIIINSNWIGKTTSAFLGDSILHEIVHAITVPAINNPQSTEDKVFSLANNKTFNMFKNLLSRNMLDSSDFGLNGFVLENEKEFAAIFATDKNARAYLFEVASRADEKQSKTLFGQIKKFINSLSKFLVNKTAFTSNKEQLLLYYNILKDYLYNKPQISINNISNKELFDAVYNQYDVDMFNLNRRSINSRKIDKLLNIYERNNKTIQQKDKQFENIAQILFTRLKNIRHSSVQTESVLKLSQIIEYLADQITKVSYAEKLIGMQALASYIEPAIEDILAKLKETLKTKSLTSDEYYDLIHTDVGTYRQLAKDCKKILGDEEFLTEFVSAMYDTKPDKKDLTTREGEIDFNKFRDKFIENTINPLILVFQSAEDMCTQSYDILQNSLFDYVAPNTLKKVFDAVKNPNGEEYLQKMSEIDEDGSIFTRLGLGPIDYEQDDALKALGYLIRKANKSADNETYSAIIPLLLDLENIGNVNIEDFYETKLIKDPRTGKMIEVTTGYLVRKFNFGKFYDDYNDEMTRINRHIAKKYNIKLLDTNRNSPEEDNARFEWNNMRNKWLEENSIRRFTDDYYRALGNIPTDAVRALLSINNQIYQIYALPNVKGSGQKHPNLYNLTEEQFDALEQLKTQKKMLMSDYDEWGNLKNPRELKTARLIREFYDKLRGDNNKNFKKDRDDWEELRSQFLESLGATGFYDRSRHYFDEAGIKAFMDSNKEAARLWKLWNQRMSRYQFKVDQDGNPLVFQQIEMELGRSKPNYGERDNALSKQIHELLRIFFGTNGHVHDEYMSKAMLKKIVNLIALQQKLRWNLRKKNQDLNALAEAYGAIFNKYIKFEETERFKLLKEAVYKKLHDAGYEGDDLQYYFFNLMRQYATIRYQDWERQIPVGYRPFSWFTVIKAIDEEKWMEWVPGDNFTDIENSASYKNTFFKEEYRVSYIPKGNKYDNSKKYNKVKDTDLYKHIVKVMDAAYANMVNRSHADPYLLPQITGSLMKRLLAHSGFKGKVDGTLQWIYDNVGLNGITLDDSEYGAGDEDISDDSPIDETLSDKMNRIGTLSNMPDGRSLHMIPQFYTKRRRPEYISKDLIGIIATFYNMSARYKYKSEIKNDCETIVDMLEHRLYKNKKSEKNTESVLGINTNVYKAGRKFLDMNLYGIRRNKGEIKISPQLNWEYTKSMDLLRRYTTANNLGANPKVALVGFMTTYYGHLINALCQNGYSGSDARFGAKIVSTYVIDNIVKGAATLGYSTDLGLTLSDRTLVLLMEKFNLSNQFRRKVEHTNWTRAQKVLYENSIFGLLASADFLSKSTILVSVMHAFRFVDGKFINKDGIIRESVKLPEDQRESYVNEMLKKYNDKNTKTMYDVVYSENKLLKIKEKYKAAFDEAFYIVQATAEKLAERADGMATEEQKAAITQSILGSLILIHRQYLPLQWTERFTSPVYDFDMLMYKGGQFNMLYKYIKELTLQSTKNSIATGVLLGLWLGHPVLGLAGGAILGRLTRHMHKGKSIKEINKEFFSDFSTEDKSLRSLHNRKIRRLILWEVAVCKSIAILVSILCKIADEPDKKDDKLLLFMALTGRLFLWEAYTPYRPDDTMSAFKTVTASTGTYDDMENVLSASESFTNHIIGGYLMPSRTTMNPLGILFDTLPLGEQKDVFRNIRSGAYKDHSYAFKVFAKLFPWSNMYELYEDSKGKRKYIENQIMKLNN